MKAQDYKEMPLRPVQTDGAESVSMRWLISQKEAPNFVMRMFEVAKNGHTPLHSHETEHEVFILEGQGELVYENEKKPFRTGYVVYVEPNKMHQFRNTGESTLKFICLIPNN
ncbi:MAG: cupin domain-containing protein [Planctomycetota bacterium]|nr:cupin domain-containing protein [Planctomycetota bacterium]MDI6788515.1 cupin domain-containing protein [Planctomycetota bacterium]